MVDNNKILTVSYGTFSCTLEGFDDPFGAMKSIAEYFRGLAEKDRSFGAEPVAPDTAVLHQIAERESLKQVDAQVEDKGIILRQSDEDLNVQEAAAPVATQATVSKLDTAVAEPQEIPRENEAGAAHDLSEDDALSKLSRLRAVALDDYEASDEFLEDEHAASAAKSSPADLDDLNDIEELISNHAHASEVKVEEEPMSETADRDAKRQRVKDRIAMNDDGAPNAETLGADLDIDENRVSSTLAASLGAAMAVSAMDTTSIEEEDGSDDAMDEAAQVSRVLRVKRQRLDDGREDVVVAETNTPGSDSIEDATEIEVVEVSDAMQEDIPALTAEDEADLAAELAQLEAETRAELEAQAEAEQEHAPDFAAVAPLPPLSLDDTLRVAVQEVSAKVDEDTPAEDAETVPQSELHHEIEALLSTMEAESRVDARRERRAQVFDEQEATQDDTALERILAETNTHMDDQDASRRRNSISHLKAAVQATRADLTSGADKGEAEEEVETPYRSDLAQAVKPASPEATTTNAPEPRRASPLVLVSEQRIKETDAEQDPTATAARDRVIRPRRVNVSTSRKRPGAAGTDPDAEPATSTNAELDAFTTFAADVDHSDIAGYMRAAAAFVTQSSGKTHFNRPQVVKLVTQLDVPGSISREDALRAFGRLLRDGDIIKVAQGCYSLTAVDQGGLQTA
ncbi:hypothetical protein [Aliiroseovarius sp. S253]|uniref:hypothetical protein n=1 Tax=Aliiroseovarius sp. S253 TaxID=3415133 RepID=UPI003C7E1AA8